MALPASVGYVATKFGVRGLTKAAAIGGSLSALLGPQGMVSDTA